MNIVCIGGGPAGLYFALLMKKLGPHHDITVVERNKPYDTFGWGVVFSDQTLDNMRQWDPEKLGRQTFYEPVERGFEREIRKRLDYWARLRAERNRS